MSLVKWHVFWTDAAEITHHRWFEEHQRKEAIDEHRQRTKEADAAEAAERTWMARPDIRIDVQPDEEGEASGEGQPKSKAKAKRRRGRR